MQKWIFTLLFNILAQLLPLVAVAEVWNNPHAHEQGQNTLYAAITGSPKTLDPAKAYSSDEIQIIAQIYEPILEYHLLKRPYQLQPLTAEAMPTVRYYTASGKQLQQPIASKHVAYSVYEIAIKPGIYYQPFPAFAKDKQGHYRYLTLTPQQIKKIKRLKDFSQTGTRELTAADYVYEIKRLASPKTSSPIFGTMNKYILGFDDFAKQVQAQLAQVGNKKFIDLRKFELVGVKVIDRYHYQIKIKGVYPQFKYWLAMTFFAPIPWEVDAFYSQPGLANKDISLNWYPVGTGPYMLVENNPSKEIILLKNPNYHPAYYPETGESTDREKGYLDRKGERLPFVNKVVFALDKESIPRWNKFLQGYYDSSGVGPDSFDQAIRVSQSGEPVLSPSMQEKHIRLSTSAIPGIFYMGFNMLDPVVGGYSEEKKKLRQAITIAINEEQFISIFLNGRGIPAQGPLPPTIYGHLSGKAGINPYVYKWERGKARRRSITYAKKLLREAGYPNGIDPKTGKPLIVSYDVATTGSPEDKARFDWLREQFAKIGLKLNIRSTLYNRFQDKVRNGKVQIFSWGWLADYPDPENFLFLLYGSNGKVEHGGENATNYQNPKVDELFRQIRILPNGPERMKKIQALLEIVRKDSPWIWGYYPISFALSHQWSAPNKPNPIVNNGVKYQKIDVALRDKLREKWNQPALWPFALFALFLCAIAIPLIIMYHKRERRPAIKRSGEQDAKVPL